MKLNSVLLTALLCLLSSLLFSQSSEAIINISTKNDLTNIQGLFVNNLSQQLNLDYKMTVSKSGPNGTSNNSQSGSFTVKPNESANLSSTTINFKKQDEYKIQLSVFYNGALIAQDSISTSFADLKIAEKTATTPTTEKNIKPNIDNIEIDGLILDETRTKTARDFYDIFYQNWVAPIGAKDFSISIKELPSRGRAASISVSVNDQLVFRQFMQPRIELIETKANQAINAVKRHLQNNENVKNQLEKEDQEGSGIF